MSAAREPLVFGETLLRSDVLRLVEFVQQTADRPLDFAQAVDLVTGKPPTLVDLAEFVVDHLNEHVAPGYWYSLEQRPWRLTVNVGQ